MVNGTLTALNFFCVSFGAREHRRCIRDVRNRRFVQTRIKTRWPLMLSGEANVKKESRSDCHSRRRCGGNPGVNCKCEKG